MRPRRPEPSGEGPGPVPSLLEQLQRVIERTYRMETGIREIGRFVIGDEGYRRFYAGRPAAAEARSGLAKRKSPGARALPVRSAVDARAEEAGDGPGARVLVRETPEGLLVRLYYPDRLIRHLEAHPPTRGLDDENVDAFATFVEELDHLLLLAERARLSLPVSLIELEMHANVTKYLASAAFLAGALAAVRPLRPGRRAWLRWHLFEKVAFAEPDPVVQTRYADALRFARRFLDRLDAEPDGASRLARLRAFHDSTHQGKIAALA